MPEGKEETTCTVCGRTFKNKSGLIGHLRIKHPGELGLSKSPPKNPPGEKEVPDAARDFEALLNDYGVGKASIIVKNIAATGGPAVFDTPKEMATKLAQWPRDLAPMYRASILEHWFKSRGIILPEELLEEVSMEAEEKKEKDRKVKAEKQRLEGAVWTIDVDESGMPRIRMIKDETEPGVTLAEAKIAAKEIGKEHEEPTVIYNETLGKHMPNFKSAFVQQNLSVAWATARQMDKSLAEGETVDPMDVWLEQQAKMSQMKELLGVRAVPETNQRGMTEMIEAIKALQGIVLAPPPGNSGVVEELKTKLADLTQTIYDMREDSRKQEIATIRSSMEALAEAHKKQVEDLTIKMETIGKATVGRTEMDILHDIATEGIGLAKTELPGIRRDLKEAISSVAAPLSKTFEQREDRKNKFKQALDTDREIEEIGRRIFLSDSSGS